MTNKKIQLNKDQKVAFEQIVHWFNKSSNQYLTLGGYAGTGKTTLISHLRQYFSIEPKLKNLKIAFCCFTGKATNILKQKLVNAQALPHGDSCSTIHRLIYEPIADDNGNILGWRKKSCILADLIIIDEASMVDETIWNDLRSYNTKILAVGDHGQLPPIEGNFNLMASPEIKLENIVRQAANNPIIRLSQVIREGSDIEFGEYEGKVFKLHRGDSQTNALLHKQFSNFNEDYLVLCGFNKTRIGLNQKIRRILEFKNIEPEFGERVICLKNNYEKQIFNGMQGWIKTINKNGNHWFDAEISLDGEDYDYLDKISKYQFGKINSIRTYNIFCQLNIDTSVWRDMGDLFDWGYALTVHKAQGSEASKVFVFEERLPMYDEQMWRRWRYTAITRSSDMLYIVA